VAPKFEIGQRVRVRPVKERISPRDCDIESYAGRVGEVANYHWISPRTGQVFFIYTVRLGNDYKEVVLHEDEIEAYLA
jgi:hypothetical protein